MVYVFTRNSPKTGTIVKKLKDFFIANEKKKVKFVDQDGSELNPRVHVELSDEPIHSLMGHTITDIYSNEQPEKITNTILQLYLGKHLPVGDRDAIWLGESSMIEFITKGFIITQAKSGDTVIRKLTAKVLGFENISFQ